MASGDLFSGDPFGDIATVGGKHAPKPPDFTGAANAMADASKANTQAQIQANRPNQTNAFGVSNNWAQGPDGQWTNSQSFGNGGLGQAANGIMGQMGSTYSNPFSFSGPGIMSGDAARDQAITGAYGQATSRLDPMWEKRQENQRTQLLNQGLDPASEAYRNQMSEFGRDRNDAYSSAMNGAIAQGTSAGDSMFRNSLMGHNTAYGEQVDQYNRPMQMAQALGGLTGQSGVMGAGRAETPDLLGAAGMQQQADFRKYLNDQGVDAKTIDSILGFVGNFNPFKFGG